MHRNRNKEIAAVYSDDELPYGKLYKGNQDRVPGQNHLYQWAATPACCQRILGILEPLPPPCRSQRKYGTAVFTRCWRWNTRDFIPRRYAPRLSPSEANSVIPHNPLYNAPGDEGQPQGNACFNFSKTRYRKPFLGIWRRLVKERELQITFLGIYAIFIKCTSPCFLKVQGIFAPSYVAV